MMTTTETPARTEAPEAPRRRWRRTAALVVAAGLVLAAASQFLHPAGLFRGNPAVEESGDPPPTITADQLAVTARTRVFLGHQSIGASILEAVPDVYRSAAVTPPAMVGETLPPEATGFVADAFIGENEHPLTKIAAFDSIMRSGMADRVDVAMMKFCYLDIPSDTDVDAVFTAYRDMLAGLQRDYPDVAFVAATAPLTTEPGMRWKVKAQLGRGEQYGADENVARERFNELVRSEYAGRPLFDIAAMESTTPEGLRTARMAGDEKYYAFHDGYSADVGHLNRFGAQVVATGWLATIAQAVRA